MGIKKVNVKENNIVKGIPVSFPQVKGFQVDLDQVIQDLRGAVCTLQEEISPGKSVTEGLLNQLADAINKAGSIEEKRDMLRFLESYRKPEYDERDLTVKDVIVVSLDNLRKSPGPSYWLLFGLIPKIQAGGVQEFTSKERKLILSAVFDMPESVVKPVPKSWIAGLFDPLGDLIQNMGD
jgi:hypothetical protein